MRDGLTLQRFCIAIVRVKPVHVLEMRKSVRPLSEEGPLTHERIHTPVRGERCAHLQCFDLKAYIEINKNMAAFNKRWTCPVCGLLCKPSDLFLDMYMLTILEKTEDSVISWPPSPK
eukprot:s1548_g2.t1